MFYWCCLISCVLASYCNFEQTRPDKTGEEIRIQYGGWETQITNNYIFLIFLRDYLNLNASFWPVTGVDEWYSVIDYPISTHEWLANNELSLSMEMWPYPNHEDVQNLLPGIVDLGNNGMHTTMGWYVPDYLAKAHPEIIQDPRLLVDLESEFIARNGKFDILAVGEDWLLTKQAILLVNTFSLNATVNIFNSEDALSERLMELIVERKWFVSSQYEPHIDFRNMLLTPLEIDCKYMTISDCWYPHVGTTQKLLSPRLNSTMPEVRQYVENFKITNAQLYEIITLRGAIHDYEKAICIYLEQNEWLFEQILHGHENTHDIVVPDSVINCPRLQFKNGNVTYSNILRKENSTATLECAQAFLWTPTFPVLTCSGGIWIDPSKQEAQIFPCGIFSPSNMLLRNDETVYRFCYSRADCNMNQVNDFSSCGEAILEMFQPGICDPVFYVDTLRDPSICLCRSDVGGMYNGSLMAFHLSACMPPSIPQRAYIKTKPIEKGFYAPRQTIHIGCKGSYQYEGEPLRCRAPNWIGSPGVCKFEEDCWLVLTLVVSIFAAYVVGFWIVSFTHSLGEKEQIHMLSKTNRMSVVVRDGSFHGELFSRRTFSYQSLLMNLDRQIVRKGLLKYFSHLTASQKIAVFLHIIDFSTDILFANKIYKTNPCIGLISVTSFTLSVISVFLQHVIDYKAWQRRVPISDRFIIMLRWDILVITPLEDLVHAILSAYLFVYGEADLFT